MNVGLHVITSEIVVLANIWLLHNLAHANSKNAIIVKHMVGKLLKYQLPLNSFLVQGH